jgi:quinol monooxygenase YgiN
MIVIRTIMVVLPEKRKEVLQTFLSLIAPLEKQKGCLNYDIYCDIEDKNVFSLISEWENHQSLDDHLRSDRFSVLVGIKSLLCEPLKFQILTVSNSEGAASVHITRKKGADFLDDNANRGLRRDKR